MKRQDITIIDHVTDPQLLGLSISEPQEVLLRSIYGMALSKSQMDIWRLCTGREIYPRHGFSEITAICGARAGKDSRIACPIASYEAALGDHHKNLTRGEFATIPLVAQNTAATRIAFGYLKSHFLDSPFLKNMLVDDPYAGEIRLTNKVNLMTFPSTQASLRGWSIPVAIMDELGFWRLEGSANADGEIQSSIRRGMVSFDRTRLIKISSPYMRSGVLYDDFKTHFAADSPDILVWRAGSTFMNPSLADAKLDQARRLDPQRFAREYLAEFSEDLEAFLANAWIEEAIMPGRHELAPSSRRYFAGVDASGGGQDAFTLSVCHFEDESVVQDVCKGWKKTRTSRVDLESVVREIAGILKRYNLRECHGDKYSANWVVESFKRAGITYKQLPFDKSVYYTELEPLFAQGRVRILDHAELARELRMLERRPRQGGKTVIDHPRGSHDDYSNSLAIAAAFAKKPVTNEKALPISIGRGIGSELAKLDRDFGKPMFGGSDGRLSQGIPARVGYDNDALDRRGGSWIIRSPFTPDDYD
jgi:hypothetical protein